jgi:cytidylate kinase
MTLHQLISRLSLFEMNRNVVFEVDNPDNSKYDIKIDHMKVKDDDVIITLRQCVTKDKQHA